MLAFKKYTNLIHYHVNRRNLTKADKIVQSSLKRLKWVMTNSNATLLNEQAQQQVERDS